MTIIREKALPKPPEPRPDVQVGDEVYYYGRTTGVAWRMIPDVVRFSAKIISIREGKFDLEIFPLPGESMVIGDVPYWTGKVNLKPDHDGYLAEPNSPREWFSLRSDHGPVQR